MIGHLLWSASDKNDLQPKAAPVPDRYENPCSFEKGRG